MATARWVHREPMKKTNHINFAQSRLLGGAQTPAARKALSELTGTRNTLLEALSKRESKPEDIIDATRNYYSAMLGLINPSSPQDVKAAAAAQSTAEDGQAPETLPDASQTESRPEEAQNESSASDSKADATGEDTNQAEGNDRKKGTSQTSSAMAERRPVQKIREAITFKWTDAVTDDLTESSDPNVEVNHMLLNTAMWFLHHASFLAHEQELVPSEEKDVAKAILEDMKSAAGILEFLKDRTERGTRYEPNTDFDERIIKARLMQAIGEGQEVIVDICSKEKTKMLTAQLARDTSICFETAADDLSTMSPKLYADIRHYLRFKGLFYKAYAKLYYAYHLHEEEEKAADAGALVAEVEQHLQEAEAEAKLLHKSSRMRLHTQPKVCPNEHKIFVQFQKQARLVGDKIKREMTMIYHAKPAEQSPPLPEPKRIFQATRFDEPARSSVWSQAYLEPSKVYAKGQDVAADKGSGDTESARAKAWTERRNAQSSCLVQ